MPPNKNSKKPSDKKSKKQSRQRSLDGSEPPDGWVEGYSKTKQAFFYKCLETKHVQWRFPDEDDIANPWAAAQRVAERATQRAVEKEKDAPKESGDEEWVFPGPEEVDEKAKAAKAKKKQEEAEAEAAKEKEKEKEAEAAKAAKEKEAAAAKKKQEAAEANNESEAVGMSRSTPMSFSNPSHFLTFGFVSCCSGGRNSQKSGQRVCRNC